jgi:hypothetical protein
MIRIYINFEECLNNFKGISVLIMNKHIWLVNTAMSTPNISPVRDHKQKAKRDHERMEPDELKLMNANA